MIDIPKALEERYGKRHLSYSSLKVALTDMAKFDQYMKGELKFTSDALDFGTLYDMLLFDRDKAMDTYHIISHERVLDRLSDKAKSAKRPQMTSEYKAVVAAMNTEAIEGNKIICSPEHWKQANDMIDRLHTCGLYERTLANGRYQVEFNDVIGGVEVKGFLDCLRDGFIIDSKSTKDIEKFRYSVRDFSYDIQAYIYTKVFGISRFYWLAQEKSYPYLPALIECSEETLFTGGMKFDEAVRRIARFLKDGGDPMTDFLEFKV